MTRILDERDKSEIKQEIQVKDELLNQRMEVEDNAIKATMKEEDNKIYDKIKNEDDAIKTLIAEEDQILDDKIQDLTTDTTNKITDLNEKIDAKVDKDGDKVLSENDLTDELKMNYDASYMHSQQTHAPSDAEMNVQADWLEENVDSDSYILNKPILGTMAAKNIVEKGDLSTDIQASLSLADTSFQPEDLMIRVSEGYIQYTTDSIIWHNLMPVSELSQLSLRLDDEGVLYLG